MFVGFGQNEKQLTWHFWYTTDTYDYRRDPDDREDERRGHFHHGIVQNAVFMSSGRNLEI